MTGPDRLSIANSYLPPARKAQLLSWCAALAPEKWLTAAERDLVKRMRSQLASDLPFHISDDRQEALAALVGRMKPTGAVH